MAPEPQRLDSKVRFDAYEADPRSGELRKHGIRIPLEDRPFRALLILLSHANELVTREELQKRLWPSDVFIDFDHGLNTAIRKIRRALNDTADEPRFIETVGGRGYRFLGQVERQDGVAPLQSAAKSPASKPFIVPLDAQEAPAAAEPPSPEPRETHFVGRRAILAIAAGVIVLPLAYLLRPAMPWPHVVTVEQLTKIGQAWHLEPMFTDGLRVYYTSSDDTFSLKFRQVLLNGNEDTLVAGNAPGYRIRGLSANDTEFLATFLGALWTVPVGGGSPRRLGNLSAGDAAWSHDGRVLAYCQNGELFLASPDGAGSRLLAAVAGGIYHIRWSPDDRRLRFTVLGSTGQQALWETSVDGHQLRELRFNWPGNPMECCGEWTPDGLYFVFRSRRQGNSNLWALEDKADWWHRANRDPVQLSSGPINYFYPLPSRDGKRIFAIGSLPTGELVRYDAEHKDFVPFLRGLSADALQFSRDKQWVTYVAVPEATLWRARSDGSEQLQLTFSPFQVFTPRWSPDGKRIVFSAKKPGEVLRTYTISVDGGNPDPLPSEPQSQAFADWMPGGDSIIYSRDPVVEAPSDHALYTANLRTGRSEKVPGTDGLYEPLWSPDGHHLAAREAASHQVLLVDLSAGSRAQLFMPYEWSLPVWSVDSQCLYFTSQDGLTIFSLRIADGRREKIIDTNFRLSSRYIGFTPDGSLLLLREHGRSDVYALSLSVP